MKPQTKKLIPILLVVALAVTSAVVGLFLLSQHKDIAQNPTPVNITPPQVPNRLIPSTTAGLAIILT